MALKSTEAASETTGGGDITYYKYYTQYMLTYRNKRPIKACVVDQDSVDHFGFVCCFSLLCTCFCKPGRGVEAAKVFSG